MSQCLPMGRAFKDKVYCENAGPCRCSSLAHHVLFLFQILYHIIINVSESHLVNLLSKNYSCLSNQCSPDGES